MAVARRQVLPVDGQHPVTLQVAERPVVGQHVERVRRVLERPARPVAAVLPFADVRLQHADPLRGVHLDSQLQQLAEREIGAGVQRGGHHLRLPVGIEFGQRHLGLLIVPIVARHAVQQLPGLLLAAAQVVGPKAAPPRLIDPPQERRDHLPELLEHRAGHFAAFSQRVRPHPEQQRLVRLSGAVDADVRARSGRQQAAQRVERLGADGPAVASLRVLRSRRLPLAVMPLHRLDPARIRFEGPVENADVRLPQRRVLDLARDDVLPPAVRPVRVRHVPGRLLQIGHQPAPFEHLGQDVGDPLAGDVRAAELRHRVVAVLVEHPRIERLGAVEAGGGAPGAVLPDRAEELVEEQPPRRLRRARVPGEQRPLDHLRQVGQHENRAVGVAEVRSERGGFLGRERLRRGERRSREGRAHAVVYARRAAADTSADRDGVQARCTSICRGGERVRAARRPRSARPGRFRQAERDTLDPSAVRVPCRVRVQGRAGATGAWVEPRAS